VARSIRKLIDAGTPAAEIAVLYRINAQSEVYEEALTEAGVAFQVRGGEGSSAGRRFGRPCWRCSVHPIPVRRRGCPRPCARCSSRWA
jgi:hypothetical protein